MSRSLSIPSKSTSYHSLQNEAAASTVTTDSEINTGTDEYDYLICCEVDPRLEERVDEVSTVTNKDF